MIIAIDVHYTENSALIAGLIFQTWTSLQPERVYTQHFNEIAEYESGSFYKRELPCILSLLQQVQEPLEIIIIDGFVTLGTEQKAGLGMYLWQSLNPQIPVIGVAKNAFRGTPQHCEILRGESLKPLYITSAGIDLELAKQGILMMSGKHRIPTLLKLVDQYSRGISL